MKTKAVLALVIFCFVQGLNADTLLKRSSLPEEGNYNILGKLQDDKQEFKDKVKKLVVNLTKLQEQSSEFLNKLQDDKQKFDDQIKDIVTQQDYRETLIFGVPQEEYSELIEKIRDDKQKFDELKTEVQQKLQEIKDSLQIHPQNRTTKRDLSLSVSEDGIISILLGGPAALVTAFKQKVSEFEDDAKELLDTFISSFDGISDISGKLKSIVNDFVQANLTDSEIASAASSCFEAQEDAISNLVKLTVSQIQTKVGDEYQNLVSAYDYIKDIGKKIGDLLKQTTQNTSSCVLSFKCIANLSDSIVSQILDFSNGVLDKTPILQSFKDDVLPDLASFIASLEQSAQSQGSDIAQQTIECVNGKTSGVDSTPTTQ